MRLLNLNEKIKVKLTEQGKEVFNQYTNGLADESTDEMGYIAFQLWEFMKAFGHHLSGSMGDVLTQDNNIYIDETKLV